MCHSPLRDHPFVPLSMSSKNPSACAETVTSIMRAITSSDRSCFEFKE